MVVGIQSEKYTEQEAINSCLKVKEHINNMNSSSNKKAKMGEDTKLAVAAVPVPAVIIPSKPKLVDFPTCRSSISAMITDEVVKEATSPDLPPSRCGRWSQDEKLMFLYGLSLFGKGRWKKIHAYVPDRSLVQIKSHAQKVLKRLDAGENVFRKLEDTRDRLRILVEDANHKIREKESQISGSKKKRKRASTRKPSLSTSPDSINWDSIHDVDVELAIDCAIHRPKDPPTISGGSSPALSLVGVPAENPPGMYTSQLHHQQALSNAAAAVMNLSSEAGSSPRSSYYGSPTRSPPSEMTDSGLPNGGTGAVIAAVAALCQLSAAATDS